VLRKARQGSVPSQAGQPVAALQPPIRPCLSRALIFPAMHLLSILRMEFSERRSKEPSLAAGSER
jgi:hypothetical protein